MTPAEQERQWRRTLDDAAAHTMHGIITYCAGLLANARPGPLMGERPTIDIQGPDGEWRRYYVRLTEIAR